MIESNVALGVVTEQELTSQPEIWMAGSGAASRAARSAPAAG